MSSKRGGKDSNKFVEHILKHPSSLLADEGVSRVTPDTTAPNQSWSMWRVGSAPKRRAASGRGVVLGGVHLRPTYRILICAFLV